MKKIILLTLLFISSSYSASVYNNLCIGDDYRFTNGRFYYRPILSSSYSTTTNIINSNQILNNFVVDEYGNCYYSLDSNAFSLNLSSSAFNFLNALLGLLLGSMFTFFLTFLFFNRR